jgi:ketosteroid isomerase-like protein
MRNRTAGHNFHLSFATFERQAERFAAPSIDLDYVVDSNYRLIDELATPAGDSVGKRRSGAHQGMKHRLFCEQFLAALAAGDWVAMDAMLHPDFEVIEADGLPFAGIYRGPKGWRELSNAILATWSGFQLRLLEMHGGDEDAAILRFAMSGRSRKTGRAWETTALELWNIRDGKLLRIDPYYFDTDLLAKADAE